MIDFYSNSYDSHMIIGDFNMEIEDTILPSLMGDHNLNSLVKSPTCFKSDRGRCIDLILTNKQHSCFSSQTFKTGFSDLRHLAYTMLKTTSVKLPQRKSNIDAIEIFQKASSIVIWQKDLKHIPRMTTMILSEILSKHLINMRL